MLHTSGTAALEENPASLCGPVKIPEIDLPVLPHHFSEIAKNCRRSPLNSSSLYSGPNFPSFGNQNTSLVSEIGPYTPFQNFHFGNSKNLQISPNNSKDSNSRPQNHPPSDSDIYSSNAMNFTNVDQIQSTSKVTTFSFERGVDKTNIFASHVHTKAFHKQIGMPADNQINFEDLPYYPITHKTEAECETVLSKSEHDSLNNDEEQTETNPIQIPETQSTISKTQFTKSNSSYKETSDSTTEVNVKIEQYTDERVDLDLPEVTEIDYENPFVRDSNGLYSEDTVEPSLDRALDDVQNGVNTLYKCEACSLVFSHAKRFLIHDKWHKSSTDKAKGQDSETGGIYACKDCSCSYPTKNKLKYHRLQKHVSAKKCTICDLVLPDWKSLNEHTQQQHMSESEFKCDVCNKTFKYRHTLARHTKIHSEKSISCDQCPKMFTTQQHLTKHLKVHTHVEQGLTHHCAICGKGFYEAYNLQVHERSHRNERPFKCDICQTSYSTNSSLQRHIKVSHNSATKAYECDICHRMFATEESKDIHLIRNHTDEAKLKYECNICKEKFVKSKDLTKHTFKVHPKSRKRRRDSE